MKPDLLWTILRDRRFAAVGIECGTGGQLLLLHAVAAEWVGRDTIGLDVLRVATGADDATIARWVETAAARLWPGALAIVDDRMRFVLDAVEWAAPAPSPAPRAAAPGAIDALREIMARHPEGMPLAAIQRAMRTAGYSRREMRLALRSAGGRCGKAGYRAGTTWRVAAESQKPQYFPNSTSLDQTRPISTSSEPKNPDYLPNVHTEQPLSSCIIGATLDQTRPNSTSQYAKLDQTRPVISLNSTKLDQSRPVPAFSTGTEHRATTEKPSDQRARALKADLDLDLTCSSGKEKEKENKQKKKKKKAKANPNPNASATPLPGDDPNPLLPDLVGIPPTHPEVGFTAAELTRRFGEPVNRWHRDYLARAIANLLNRGYTRPTIAAAAKHWPQHLGRDIPSVARHLAEVVLAAHPVPPRRRALLPPAGDNAAEPIPGAKPDGDRGS